MVLIDVQSDNEEMKEAVQFPSPCGDYGSYLCHLWQEYDGSAPFPSPCGDYGSYH